MSADNADRMATTDQSGLPPGARCLHCGYLLQGLPKSVCPECGRGFSPIDPTTYRDPRRVTRWLRYATPPPRWQLPAAVMIALFLSIAYSNPATCVSRNPYSGLDCFWRLLQIAALVFVFWMVLDWVRRQYAIYRVVSGGFRDEVECRTTSPRWLLQPVLILFVLITCMSAWPLRCRFALSRPALEDAAQAQLAAGTSSYESRWIGLYYVNGIFLPNTGGVLLDTCWVDHSNRPPVSRVGFFLETPGCNRGSHYCFVRLEHGWWAANW